VTDERQSQAGWIGVPGGNLILTSLLSIFVGFLVPWTGSCGEVDIRDGPTAGFAYCEDISGRYHFQVEIPPWRYTKEYRCSSWEEGQCVGTWTATGRYVYVVSDVPFVNFDSEIVSSLDVKIVSGSTAALVEQLIAEEDIGVEGNNATFFGDPTDYPREVEALEPGQLPGHEVLWREKRDFQGSTYNWYRRDVFLAGSGGNRYHLRFFSIDRLDLPEFDLLIQTFREGPAEDGAPECECQDEHDPAGVQEC
jgi:hypothetical protein